MTAVKEHWITGLSFVGVVFLVATGIGMIVSGGEFAETGVRVFGVVAVTAGLSVAVGLWGLRNGGVEPRVANGLIVLGMIVLGAGYWWFVFVPPIVALAVLWAGVVKKGLVRELRPT
jgi:hypothetical protein